MSFFERLESGEPVSRELLWIGENAPFGRYPLTIVDGPFERIRKAGEVHRVLAACHESPEAGDELVNGWVAQTSQALEACPTGILYVLSGVEPALSTPMEYGGIFLEWDRRLLETACAKSKVVLMIQGGQDAYLDFVADLPADLFVWDDEASGVSLEAVRAMRSGPLACSHPKADVVWPNNDLSNVLAGEPIHA